MLDILDLSSRFRSAIAQDTFSRSNQSGFGTASDGGSWSTVSGTETLAIASNQGTVTGVTALAWAQLGTHTIADVDVTVQVSVSSANYTAAGVFARGNGSNSGYRCRINSNNSAQGFGIVKTSAGTTTNLFLSTISITTNTLYTIRFRAIGSNLSAKIWLSSGSEPTAWTVSGNDTTFSSGQVGIITNTTSSGDTAKYQSFVASDAQPTLVRNHTSVRFRLAAQHLVFLAGRALIAAQHLQNVAGRIRLQITTLKNTTVRFIQHATINRDLAIRVLVIVPGLNVKNLLSRVILLAASFKNIAARLRLQSSTLHMLAARLRVVSPPTALTMYYAHVVSSTLSTAYTAYVKAGTPPTIETYTTIGLNLLGFGEVASQGSSSWAGTGLIGSPTGKGFLYDVATLEGNTLAAGYYTATVRLNAAQGSGSPFSGTLVGDLYIRVFKRSSSGVYTPIVVMSLAAQTLNTAPTTYTLPATQGVSMNFVVGDKIYTDIWFNCFTNSNGSALQGIRFNRLSTDSAGQTGDPFSEIVTPGYSGSLQPTIPLRFRLFIASIHDVAVRYQMTAAFLKSLPARFPLQVFTKKEISSRLRGSAQVQVDWSARFNVSIGTFALQILQMRYLSVSSPTPRDIMMRLYQQVTNTFDVATRLFSLGFAMKDVALRAVYRGIPLQDLFVRVLLQGQPNAGDILALTRLIDTGVQDMGVRFNLFEVGGVKLGTVTDVQGTYQGTVGMAPVNAKNPVYLIGGQPIDTPMIRTAPLSPTPNFIPTGSVFTLIFSLPTGQSQFLLVDGSLVNFTFPLVNGMQVTGLVLMDVDVQGAFWQVTCTTLAPISTLFF